MFNSWERKSACLDSLRLTVHTTPNIVQVRVRSRSLLPHMELGTLFSAHTHTQAVSGD